MATVIALPKFAVIVHGVHLIVSGYSTPLVNEVNRASEAPFAPENARKATRPVHHREAILVRGDDDATPTARSEGIRGGLRCP